MYTRFLLIGALLISAGSAWAHDAKGTHGGTHRRCGSHPCRDGRENPDVVEVFISDESEKPVYIGLQGTAILVAGGKSQRVVLAPVDGTRLSGRAAAALPNQPEGPCN